MSEAADPEFEPEEYLYLRLKPACWTGEAPIVQALLNHVRFPAFSVNRGKYSKPEDVLQPEQSNWGIGSFRVGEIPGPLYQERKDLGDESDADKYTFGAVHLPEHDNYAHSEVQSSCNGVRNVQPSKTVKLEFRSRLRERIHVLKAPSA